MTEVELRKLDDEMLDAYLAHDVDLILSHCSDDVVIHDFGEERMQGKAAAREYLGRQFATFSDERATRTRRIIGDHAVFSELDWTCFNTWEVPLPDGSTIPATGKTVGARLAYYARVNDEDEVVEMRGYPDLAALMGQLGLMG